MPKKAITIYLEGGSIPIEQFSEAIAGWVEQLGALRDELNPNAKIDWVITDLKKGSAVCTIRGVPAEGTSDDDVEGIITGYEDEWESFKNGVPSRHSYPVQSSTRKVTSILNGQVTAIRTKTETKEISISSDEQKAAFRISKGFTSFGAVTGKIQTISVRSTNHFLLYDVDDDHKITCYLHEGAEKIMRDVWGKVAVVEGELYRDAKTSKVITVRDITLIEPVAHLGGWRDAVGIAPAIAGSISPEEAIRRTRGG